MRLFKKYMSDNNKNYLYKTVDIIIPIYNGYNYLEKLFNQIKNNTDLDYNLYVIDDKSSDSRVLPLLKNFEKIFNGKMHLVENQTNLGFLKTVNKGLELTNNDVCILNTDIELPPKWTTRLMYYIFKYDDIASVTPFSNAATIFSFPEMWIDNDLEIDYKLIDKMFSKFSLESIPLLDFPTGVGFCMAMSRKSLDKIGFFDEIYEKGYGEENDWCMRALRAGFKNVLCPNLFIYHKHGGSFDSKEKKELCEKHLKILNSRYPEYSQLVTDSSKNKYYLNIRNQAINQYNLLLKKKNIKKNIFSLTNNNTHKILTVLGIKFKFKSQKLIERIMLRELNDNAADLRNKIDSQSIKYNDAITNLNSKLELKIAKLQNLLDYYSANLEDNVVKKHSKVVYTCITGDYDNLIQHTYIDKDYDYICFTDNQKLIDKKIVGIWKIKPLLFNKLDNTKNARWHKINYFNCVSEYSQSIWVDASIDILTDYIFKQIENSDKNIIIPLHYRNDCIFQECDYVLECRRDTEENVEIVRKFLKSQNMPEHYGLNETNIIYRNHSWGMLPIIMKDWFECIEKYSKRDQLSCSYAMWKNGVKIEDISISNARLDRKNFFMADHIGS